MSGRSPNPFDSLESTYEYICLLEEALREARDSVDEDTAVARHEDAVRRLQALQIVRYKLDSLETHMKASRRLVNDLRMLRRMLLGEREHATQREADLHQESLDS